MTILGLTCQNPKCSAYNEPLAEAWSRTWGEKGIKLVSVFCDSCHYVPEENVVSSSMGNEAWVETPKRPPPRLPAGIPERKNPSRSSGGAKIEHAWLFFLVLIVLIGFAFAIAWQVEQKQDEPRFETVTVDGVRCIYDNQTEEIESCDWGPR